MLWIPQVHTLHTRQTVKDIIDTFVTAHMQISKGIVLL